MAPLARAPFPPIEVVEFFAVIRLIFGSAVVRWRALIIRLTARSVSFVTARGSASSVEDIVALVEAGVPKSGKRGPYKKRIAA